MTYGVLSLLPIIVVLAIAFKKKNVFIALIVGLVLGSLILSYSTADYLVGIRALSEVFSLPSTSQVIFFLFLTGALMHAANKSGGVEGLVRYCTEKRKIVTSRWGVEFFTFILGLLLFIDALSSIMITSSVGKPFFKKYQIPDEKLALISNSTGAAITWLIPFSGAGALMTSFLAPIVNDLNLPIHPFELLASSVMYQFYTIFLFIILLFSICFRKEIGPMRQLMQAQSLAHHETDIQFGTDIPCGHTPQAINLLLPVTLLVSIAFIIVYITGEGNIIQGDITIAMFASGILTLLLTGVSYIAQGLVTMDKYIDWCLEGMHTMFDVILIFVLAYAFGALLHDLDTAGYVAHYALYFPEEVILLAVLAVTSCVAYAIGSSSATVALLFPIFVPMAYEVGIPLVYTVGAVVSGAIFGDQNSPISDSVILTSKISGVNSINHVRTQIPYTGLALLLAFISYGILMWATS